MNNLDDYSIRDDLPESLARDNIKDLAEVVDKALHQYNIIIPRVLIYPVIDTLSEDMVDALAVQLHCDFYDYALPLERKREIVKQSIAWHRIKGTPAAVEELVTAVFGKAEVAEWYQYGGEPYTFRLFIEGKNAFDGKRNMKQLMAAVEMSKNKRSHLDGIDLLFSEELPLGFGMALPVSTIKSVDIGGLSGVDTEIDLNLPTNLWTADNLRGVFASLPEGTGAADDLAFLQAAFLPKYVKAADEEIDIPDYFEATEVSLKEAFAVFAKIESVQTGLPAKGETSMYEGTYTTTLMTGVDSALPANESSGVPLVMAMGCILPGYIKAKECKEVFDPDDIDARLSRDEKTILREGVYMSPSTTGLNAALPAKEQAGVSFALAMEGLLPDHIKAKACNQLE